jgi:hypothetical protein
MIVMCLSLCIFRSLRILKPLRWAVEWQKSPLILQKVQHSISSFVTIGFTHHAQCPYRRSDSLTTTHPSNAKGAFFNASAQLGSTLIVRFGAQEATVVAINGYKLTVVRLRFVSAFVLCAINVRDTVCCRRLFRQVVICLFVCWVVCFVLFFVAYCVGPLLQAATIKRS